MTNPVKSLGYDDDDEELFLWLTDERRLVLFPAIVGDPHFSNLRHAASRICTCAEPDFRLY